MKTHYLKHFLTVTKHRLYVLRLCFKVGLYKQGLLHDLSKYSYDEFINGGRYYLGYRSPTGNERKAKGYSMAYLHHVGRNKHHPEYWRDLYDPKGRQTMPKRYIIESICDRIAAAKIYNIKNYNDAIPLEYYLKDEKLIAMMNDEEDQSFRFYLIYLKDHGEKKLLEYLKKEVKNLKKSGQFKL